MIGNWLESRQHRWWLILCLAAILAVPGPAARALEPLPSPRGEVILTVGGQIGRHNAGGEARFDRSMLMQLGWSEVVTATPWHPKVMRFEGVPLRAVLDAVGASGNALQAVAHNDYAIVIPLSDVHRYNVILAMKADGEEMTLRDKGPLFIIYPYDSDPALRTDSVYIRSVWQLKRLDVRP